MAMTFTAEQLHALDAKGRVLVSAAAGSGKTAVLVERTVGHILNEEQPVDADRLLVVTFTNAAAAEMRERIALRLASEIRKQPNNIRLKRQQFLLSKAMITTIDSFCISLAREYFYKLNISPDFKVADGAMIRSIENDAMQTVLDRFFEEKTEGFLKLVSDLGAQQDTSALETAVFALYNHLRTLPFPERFMQAVLREYQAFDLQTSPAADIVFSHAKELVCHETAAFNAAVAELEQEPALAACYLEGFLQSLDALRQLQGALCDKDWDRVYEMCRTHVNPSIKNAPRGYADQDFKEQMQQAKKSADGVFSKLSKLFNLPSRKIKADMAKSAPAIEALLSIVRAFKETTDSQKRSKNCMDFADVEEAVLHLLVQDINGQTVYTDVAKELSGRYHEVLVDEYQDTNDLQDTIFMALSDGGAHMFMVGDVKQSIYGFRRANPGNFIRNRNALPDFEPGCNKSRVILSGNFRSAPQVCDFVNFAFFKLLSVSTGQMDYEQADMLDAKASFCDIDIPRVAFRLIDGKGESAKRDERAKAEAEHTAAFILQTIAGAPVITENGEKRKAQYRDFAILLRDRKDMACYEKALYNAGIPCCSDTPSDFLQTEEIQTILALLSVIDNPHRDIPFLQTLFSDLFLFTAEEVAKIRVRNRRSDLYGAMLTCEEKSEKIRSFLKTIDAFRQTAVSAGVGDLITSIYDTTGYLQIVSAKDGGEQRRLNLLYLLEIAKNGEQNGMKGLSAFLRYIRRSEKNGVAFDQPKAVNENDNAVKIMTIHHSKGLQFPICIVAGLSNPLKAGAPGGNLQISDRCGIGMQTVDEKRRIRYATVVKSGILIEKTQFERAEDLRVLYVALTRAKDMLVLSAFLPDASKTMRQIASGLSAKGENSRFDPVFVRQAGSYIELLLACAMLQKDGQALCELAGMQQPPADSCRFAVEIVQPETISLQTKEEAIPAADPDPAIVDSLQQRLAFVYPFEGINAIAAKQTASKAAHREAQAEYTCTAVPLFLQHKTLTAAQKGTAMHAFMELCDFEKACAGPKEEIDRLVALGKITKEEGESLSVASIRAFFASPLYQRIAAARRVYKEHSFMVQLPAHLFDPSLPERFAKEPVVVQGIVDLIYENEQGLVIVDYKTDRVQSMETLREKYHRQLEIYKLAVEQTLSLPVRQCILYSLFLDQEIDV